MRPLELPFARLRAAATAIVLCAALAAAPAALKAQPRPATVQTQATSATRATPQNTPQGPAQNARVRLTGRVVDASGGEGVPYATVSLADTLGVPVTAWITDGKGEFSHDVRVSGRFAISAAAVDFDRSTKTVEIAAPATEIGVLELGKGVAIEGVTVTATPPLIKSEIDKLTYNVAADPEAPVNTLLDMLRKVPLLSVDGEDNVLMQGQSNYKVLVNGKSSSMMDNNFREVVRSMPAGSIKNIEVITQPSSRYEAEGIGGIINIITDRGRIGGYNGSVNAGVDSRGGVNGGGYLSASIGKLTVSGYGNAMNMRQPWSRSATFQENYLSDDYRYQNGTGRTKNTFGGAFYNVQASYEADSLNLFTLSLWGQNFNSDSRGESATVITNAAHETVRQFDGLTNGDQGMGYLSGSVDYQRLFRKPDRVFTASYKLEANDPHSTFTTAIDGIVDYRSYMQRTVNDARSAEHTVQLDFVEPITAAHNVEAGVKFILRTNDSDPETSERTADTDPWAVDPARRNALDYDQYILGVYGAYTYKLKSFSAKVGARVENTRNDGMFRNAVADTPFDNRMFNLVPYVSLSYNTKTGKRLTLAYTQRLSRPSIWYLNPYVNDLDPMNVSTGNPELDSEVGHTFDASWGSFGPKTTIRVSGGAAFVNNAIENVSTSDAQGVTFTKYYNVGRTARYNLNAYYQWMPSGKFSMSVNANGSYADLRGTNGLENDGFAFNTNANTRVALWKNGSVTANLYYSSPRVALQGEGFSFVYYGFGLSQRAFNQKVTFSLSANVPFQKEQHLSSVTEADSFYRRSEYWNVQRSARFNVSWNFGKSQVRVKSARRTITNDDQKAGGESSSAGGAGGAASGGAAAQ